jgi:Fic family protein
VLASKRFVTSFSCFSCHKAIRIKYTCHNVKPAEPVELPVEIQWEPLIPLVSRANRSLAQFDGVLSALPNPDILLSPMTIEEAVLSSRIEGTQATLEDVYLVEAGDQQISEPRREDVQEIVNYRKALEFGESRIDTKPFNLTLLRSLHSVLLDSVRGVNKSRGEFRRVQNWIGAPGCSMEDADFVPPHWELLQQHLNDWESFYHSDQPDPLVQLAMVHAQFEFLHPFLDGNGRIGRLLIPLFLYEKRILSRPMFYISAYLERERETYIRHLRHLNKTAESWQPWISFFLKATMEQARENALKTQQIIDLYKNLKGQVLALTHSQYAIPLLDLMFSRPIFNINQLYESGQLPSKQMITTLLNRLKEAKILKVTRVASGRQGQVFALASLVNLCEGRNVI